MKKKLMLLSLLFFILLNMFGTHGSQAASNIRSDQFAQTLDKYFYSDSSGIHQITRETNKMETLIENPISSFYLSPSGKIIFKYIYEDGLYIYDFTDGKVIQIYQNLCQDFIVHEDQIYLVDATDQKVHRIDLQGIEIDQSSWTLTNIKDDYRNLLFSGDSLYINEPFKGIIKVDVENQYNTTYIVKSNTPFRDFYVTKDTIYYLSLSGTLSAHDLATNRTNKLHTGAHSFVSDGQQLYTANLPMAGELTAIATSSSEDFDIRKSVTYMDQVFTLSDKKFTKKFNRLHATSDQINMKKVLAFAFDTALDAPYKKISITDKYEYTNINYKREDNSFLLLDTLDQYIYSEHSIHYQSPENKSITENYSYVLTEGYFCRKVKEELLPINTRTFTDNGYDFIISSLKDFHVISLDKEDDNYKVLIRLEDWTPLYECFGLTENFTLPQKERVLNSELTIYIDLDTSYLNKITFTTTPEGKLHDTFDTIEKVDITMEFDFYNQAPADKYTLSKERLSSTYGLESTSDQYRLAQASQLKKDSPLNAFAYFMTKELDIKASYEKLKNFNETYPHHYHLMVNQLELEYLLDRPLSQDNLDELMSLYYIKKKVYDIFLTSPEKYKKYYGKDIPYEEWLKEYPADKKIMEAMAMTAYKNANYDLVIQLYNQYKWYLSTSLVATYNYYDSCLKTGRIGQLAAIDLEYLNASGKTIDYYLSPLLDTFDALNHHSEIYDLKEISSDGTLGTYINKIQRNRSQYVLQDLKNDLRYYKSYDPKKDTIYNIYHTDYLAKDERVKEIEKTIETLLYQGDYRLNIMDDPKTLTAPTSSMTTLIGDHYDYIDLDTITHTTGNDIYYFVDDRDVTNKTLVLDLQNLSYGEKPDSINSTIAKFLGDCATFSVIKDNGSLNSYESAEYYYKYKEIIVLINDKTSGAGEVVALSLKEYGSNVRLIGTKTAGIGTLDYHYYHIKEGIDLTFPVGHWIVRQKSIDGIGISPDIEMESPTLEKVLKLITK